MATALIILAAGKGTRMKSDRPKVLHEVAGAPLLAHAMQAGAALRPERTVVVAGHGAARVEDAARATDPGVQLARQEAQLGTAHAVAQAAPLLAGFDGDAIVLYGDTAFIRPETLARMARARATHDVVVLGFEAAEPGRYGRLVMAGERLDRIVEYNDATEAQRAITFCNSGVVAADAATLFELVAGVGNANAKGEYYLTDIIGLAQARGLTATAISCDESETLGVNSRADLAAAEAAFQARARADAMADGVTLTAPETVHFAFDTVVGPDTVVEPYVVFGPGVRVAGGARIRAFSHLEPRWAPMPACGPARGSRPGPGSATSSRPRTQQSMTARRSTISAISGTRIWAPRSMSAPARSPAITTASPSTTPRSAPARSSARTRCWSPR